MTLVLDESFLTGIPANFATARAQAGTLAVSYNAGAQAVDLSNASAGYGLWDITSQPLQAAGEFEIDLEFVSDGAANYRMGGAYQVAGQATVSNGAMFRHSSTVYDSFLWSGSAWGTATALDTDLIHGSDIPFNTAGDRRVMNVRWDMGVGAGITRLVSEFRVDGFLIQKSANTTYSAFRPGILSYQGTVRLHSIKVWDAPQAPLTPIGTRGLPTPIARRVCAPPRALLPGGPVTAAFGDKLSQRNAYFGGTGQITGTVKEKNLPVNVSLHRRVCLLEEKTRLLVAETWSDATTGNYLFERIDQTRTYTVLAYDYTGLYRAVIADAQVPEVML